MNKCAIEGCENYSKTRGWCNKHYLKWWRRGDPKAGIEIGEKGSGWTTEYGYRRSADKLEHRVVMEKIIGRPLTRKEVVHHIDGDKLNNSPENLMLFASQSEHASHHEQLKREKRNQQ